MADAVISLVAERIAAILSDQISYEVNLVRSVKKELRDLSNKLETIKNVLEDAEKRGVKEQSVKKWLKRLENTAYVMDDILDEWSYALLKYKMEKVGYSFISSTCLCFKKVADRRKTAKKIESVKARVDRILKERDDFKFVMSQPVIEPPRVQSTSSIEVENVHGVDVDRNKNNIVRELMVNGDTQLVLSIVGMGGIGKTTLAQLVYNDSRVKDCFELRIWICVSDPFDVARVGREIVDSVGTESIPPNTSQLELVLQKLRDSILGKKFLLVLDDVWTEDYNQWEPLRINLRYGAEGSKILVTTRKDSVVEMMMRGNVDVQIYRPQKLTDEECWTLLCNISLLGKSVEERGKFEGVGKKIVSKCEGLPLAATVLGSLLQFKKRLEEWEDVWKSEIWKLEKAEVELFPHLLLSYNELSPPLKLCFSYCAVYPKDSRINARGLIEEWMALGYLGPVTGNGGIEVKGREYLNNLAMRSLFQDVAKSGDLIESCKMHDIVHDFAQFLRENDDRSLEGGTEITKRSCHVCNPLLVSRVQKYRSLVWCVSNVCNCLTSVRVVTFGWGSRYAIPQGMGKLIHLRRLELCGNQLSTIDLRIICRLYLLQTLLLASCFLLEIPGEIGNLIYLIHLDLSVNYALKELPERLCSLVELQILNLKSCSNLRGLPEGIHRLQNLQYLLISNTPASRHLPRGFGELSGLRTLGTGFYGGSGSNKLGLLKKLNGLSESLKLQIRLDSCSDLEELVEDAREAELRNKIHIHTLQIQFGEDEVEQSPSSSSSALWIDVIEALEPDQQKLRKLVIGGYRGSRLPHWISSPLNLVKEISLFELSDMSSCPPMGKLPFLEVLSMDTMKELKFVRREFLGIESPSSSSSSSTANGVVVAFPRLKTLEFIDCPKWREWEDITAEEEECVEVSIMPRLTTLSILQCEGVKELPHRLLRRASSSLQFLHINNSSELVKSYGDKDGSEWRSISQNNPKLELIY